MVFDEYSGQQGHIVIVISPLLSLMEDQVKSLRNLGIKTISVIHLQNEDEIQKLEKGNYSVVYATQKCCWRMKDGGEYWAVISIWISSVRLLWMKPMK